MTFGISYKYIKSGGENEKNPNYSFSISVIFLLVCFLRSKHK